MDIYRRCAVSVFCLLLQSCATISPEECKVAKWNDLGLRDGLAGRPLSRLDDIAKDCAKTTVAVDSRAYLQGRDTGLQTYCQMPNASKLWLEGQSYHGVCPPLVDIEFRRRHAIAYEVHQARENLSSQDRKVRSLERSLADAKTDVDRKRFREELSQMDYSMRRSRDRVRDAELNFERNR
jgi:hypothetical protein